MSFLSKIIGEEVNAKDENLAVSIQSHLTLLLNSRRGMTPHLEKYGLPDIHYIYYSLPHSLNRLADAIKDTVVTFEPRLQDVAVSLVSADETSFRATYRISGRLSDGSAVSRLTFETEVLRDGRSKTSLVTRYG